MASFILLLDTWSASLSNILASFRLHLWPVLSRCSPTAVLGCRPLCSATCFKTLEPGYEIFQSGYEIFEPGYEIFDPGYEFSTPVLNIGTRIRNFQPRLKYWSRPVKTARFHTGLRSQWGVISRRGSKLAGFLRRVSMLGFKTVIVIRANDCFVFSPCTMSGGSGVDIFFSWPRRGLEGLSSGRFWKRVVVWKYNSCRQLNETVVWLVLFIFRVWVEERKEHVLKVRVYISTDSGYHVYSTHKNVLQF